MESAKQDVRQKSVNDFAEHLRGAQKADAPSFSEYCDWCATHRTLPATERDFEKRFASQLRAHKRRMASRCVSEFLCRVFGEARWDDAGYQNYTRWCEQNGNQLVSESQYRGLLRARRRVARSQSVTDYIDAVQCDNEWTSASYENYLEVCQAQKTLAIAKQQFEQRLGDRMDAEAKNSVADFVDTVARNNEWQAVTYDRYYEVCQSEERLAIDEPSFGKYIAARRRTEQQRSAKDFTEYACAVDYAGEATYADYVVWCRDNMRLEADELVCTSSLRSGELTRATDEFRDWLEYCKGTRRGIDEYEGYVAWCRQHVYFAYRAIDFSRACDVTLHPRRTVLRKCPECGGMPVRSGTGSCSGCSGSGRVLTRKTRQRHAGTRISRSGLPVDNYHYENVYASCPICRGTGTPQITCEACNGQGSIHQQVNRTLGDIVMEFERPLRPSHPQEE